MIKATSSKTSTSRSSPSLSQTSLSKLQGRLVNKLINIQILVEEHFWFQIFKDISELTSWHVSKINSACFELLALSSWSTRQSVSKISFFERFQQSRSARQSLQNLVVHYIIKADVILIFLPCWPCPVLATVFPTFFASQLSLISAPWGLWKF